MSFLRDMAWQHFDQLQRSSISYQFANYALSVNYEMLPADVVHQAKRCLLDVLGCAIGGYDAPGRPMCEEAVKELGGSAEATVFGSGLRTSASNATLVNSFMARFLDFNDMGGGSHNSDSIPAVLAVGERQKAGGRDLLTALVISYELGARFAGRSGADAAAVNEWNGWFADTRAGLTMPATLGKMMGLTAEQIANAIGICATGNMVLHVVDTSLEEKTMRKNIRFGWGSCAAIVSCLLAKRGFTGPIRVVEGERGMNEVLFNGEMDLVRLTDFRGWRILNTRFKYFAAQATLQGSIGATLHIVQEHDLKPADIAAVRIRMRPSHSARPTVPLKYPRNAETADHSPYFMNAMAIINRTCGVEAIEPQNFTDPLVLDLMDRIKVETDSNQRGTEVEITTKNGQKHQKQVGTPHGFADDPLSDEELEIKFKAMAAKHIGAGQIQKLIKTIWNVEKLDDIGELTKLMVFQPH